MGQKRAKISVFWPKMAIFADFLLAEYWGNPPPISLAENHSAEKSLAELRGNPS